MANYNRVRSFVAHNLIKAGDFEAEFDGLTANLNDRIHSDGAVQMVANLTFDQCGIVVDNRDSSGSMWRLRDYLGAMQLDLWDVSLTPDAYTNILSIPTNYAAGEVTLRIPLTITHTTPYLALTDTTSSAQSFRFKVNADTLLIENYTDPAWATVVSITDDTVSITGDLEVSGDAAVTGDLAVTGALSATLGAACVPYAALDLTACTPQVVTRSASGGFTSNLTFSLPAGVHSWIHFVKIYIQLSKAGDYCYATYVTGRALSVSSIDQILVNLTGSATVSAGETATITVTPYLLANPA